MKMKKILACVSAAALAVSAMAVSAFAESEELTGPVSFNWAIGYNQAVTGAWVQAKADNTAVKTFDDILLIPMTVVDAETGEEETKEAGIQWCTSTDWEGDIVLEYSIATAENEFAHTGSLAITSTGGWWQQDMIVDADHPLADFLGDVAPEDVTSISFTLVYASPDAPDESDDPTESTEPDEKPADADFTANMGAQLDKDFNATIGEWPADGVAYGKYEDNKAEVTIGFDFGTEKVKLAGNYLGIKTDVAFNTAEGAVNSKITVTSIKADGKEIQFDASKVFVGESDDGVGGHAKITLFNEWDDNTKGNAAVDFNAINGEDGFSTLTVTFTVEAAEEADVTTPAEGETTTDGAAGDTNKPSDDKNKPTGVMFAIVPAAVAAIGVVLSKKRK